MTHHTGLENRRSGNATEGSNPSLSADSCGLYGEVGAVHDAPFTPRSCSSDGAQVGTDTEGDSYTPNWRSRAPLYEGMAVGPFHVWRHLDGWAVYNNDRFIVGADSKPAAIKLMVDLHSSWVPAPARPKREPEGSVAQCYFIGLIDGPIKIGASVKPAERIRDLQAACPYPIGILALAGGGFATEASYHRRFAAFRLHGEWFDRHPDILAEIDRLNSLGPKRGCNLIPAHHPALEVQNG